MMKIVIQSTLSGAAAGYMEQEVTKETKICDLISSYCQSKKINEEQYFVLRTSKNMPLDPSKTVGKYKEIEDKDILFLGSSTDEDVMFGFNNWWLLTCICLFFGVVGLIAVLLVYNLDVPSRPINYGIVMDAGSTHTTSFLYTWNKPDHNGSGIVKQLDSCSGKGSGISNFVSNPSSAGASLSGCLTKLKKKIPHDSQVTTNIYLGATAGMRLLNLSDPLRSLMIMHSVENTLKDSGFSYGSSKIINGESEGKYGWITVNYLDKNFPITDHKKNHHTIGSLDLGGASTQIAHEVPTIDATPITLFGQNYSVHSDSFLCYGMSQIHIRHLASLVEDSLGADNYYDPCTPRGYNFTVSESDLFGTPCSQSVFYKNNSKEIQKYENYTFYGKSNTTECHKRIDLLFDQEECARNFPKSLCFRPITNFNHSHFLAISGFHSVASFLNATNVTLDQYENSVNTFCNKSYDQMKIFRPTKFLPKYCFDGSYIYKLLIDGYNFTSKNWKNIIFTKTINDHDLGWAMGYMLVNTNLLSEQPAPKQPITSPAMIGLCVIFGLLILLSFAFFCHASKQRRKRISYQRSGNYRTFTNC